MIQVHEVLCTQGHKPENQTHTPERQTCQDPVAQILKNLEEAWENVQCI